MCDKAEGCDHDHDHEEDLGHRYGLYQKIRLDQVTCLNEAVEGSGAKVFKPWERRLEKAEWVESDADEELLFNVPFAGLVKLKGVVLIGGEEGTHPNRLRIFKDRPQMNFDSTAMEPDQSLELARDENGTLEYPMRTVKFSSVHHLSLHFPSNFGADVTKIYYIAFRGEFQGEIRREAVVATYESSAVPQDHKGEIPEAAHHGVF